LHCARGVARSSVFGAIAAGSVADRVDAASFPFGSHDGAGA
jgi:hypothetical protein